jgi:hypothetical protein
VAAIFALIDQTQITPTAQDGRHGLVNPTLYSLAAVLWIGSRRCCSPCSQARDSDSVGLTAAGF